ncbi:hypothetical protein GCM10009596_07640 [Arthrobacter rhombi]|uniref:hypothetical protein n=1 Tax=Arthrobacter rhombi TaxID=71253 RepID=UPI0031D18AF0
MVAHVSQEPSQVTTAVNKWAVASAVLAAVCLAALVFTGVSVFAVFAVGAGHIALGQLRERGGRGHGLARAALSIGYAIGAWAVVVTVVSLVRLALA